MQAAVYSDSHIAAIAKALNVSAERVKPFLGDLEAAAWWYLVHRKPFENSDPTKLKRKLQQVSGAARRLLYHLGIDDPCEAPDGPANRAVFDAVGLWTGTNDNIVAEASGRIGRLVTLLEAIDAAKLFEELSQKAADETEELGRLTVPPGHSGDRGTNDWIAAMLAIYEKMTGKDPATSVGAPERKNEGIAGGPLIRFIQAAGKPLEIKFDEDAIRSRVRTILSQSDRN